MKSSRIFFVILVAIFAIVALTVFIRLVTNRDSTELIPHHQMLNISDGSCLKVQKCASAKAV